MTSPNSSRKALSDNLVPLIEKPNSGSAQITTCSLETQLQAQVSALQWHKAALRNVPFSETELLVPDGRSMTKPAQVACPKEVCSRSASSPSMRQSDTLGPCSGRHRIRPPQDRHTPGQWCSLACIWILVWLGVVRSGASRLVSVHSLCVMSKPEPSARCVGNWRDLIQVWSELLSGLLPCEVVAPVRLPTSPSCSNPPALFCHNVAPLPVSRRSARVLLT